MTAPRTAAESVQLLRDAIAASGLSVEEYARTVLVRDSRTVFRWLAGDKLIPAAVVDYLTRGEDA